MAHFPEIANIEKNAPVKQGGNLPLIISPANVELTNNFSFSLQGLDGKTADIQIGSPAKGLPANTTIGYYYMETRSAENDCFWTVKIDPAYDEKTNQYAEVENASLVVTNAKGTTMKTAFAYTVDADDINADVEFATIGITNTVEYAPSIDVLAEDKDGNSIFKLKNEYIGYTVLEATNALQVAKYQISIDGTKVIIGNMPANETSIKINLKLTALGLNGSADDEEVELTVSQGVEAEASLSEKAITLDKEAVKVRWNIEELGMNAIQFNSFMAPGADKVKFTATREEDGVKYLALDTQITFYDSDGNPTTYTPADGTWSGKEAATFGFNVKATDPAPAAVAGYNSEKWMPKDYTITLTSKNGTSVLFSAETTLKVSNPEVATSYIKLVPGFVENGIFQITGTPAVGGTTVSYNLKDALLLDENAELIGLADLDAWNYVNNGGTNVATAFGNYNWLDVDQSMTDREEEEDFMVEPDNNDKINLYVHKWKANPNARAADDWIEARDQQLYKTRNIRAYYSLFGNTDNVVTYDFKVVVKSEIFSTTPDQAIVMDDTMLTAVFSSDAKKNTIDFTKAITKAVVAAGTDKGKTYNLFAKAGESGTYKVYNYSTPKLDASNTYVVTSAGMPIEIAHEDLLKFGMSMTSFVKVKDTDKFYLTMQQQTVTVDGTTETLKGWNSLYYSWNKYYQLNNQGKEEFKEKSAGVKYTKDDITEQHATYISLFNAYKDKTEFTYTAGDSYTTGAVNRDSRITNVKIEFKDATEAAKYFTSGTVSGTAITAKSSAPSDVTGGQVTVPMVIKVTDQWGMTMVREFNVTVKTN